MKYTMTEKALPKYSKLGNIAEGNLFWYAKTLYLRVDGGYGSNHRYYVSMVTGAMESAAYDTQVLPMPEYTLHINMP